MSIRITLACIAALLAVPAQEQDPPPFVFPSGLTLSPAGDIILADRGAHRVFRIDPKTGRTSVLAGTGTAAFSGDGGSPLAADLRNPEWVEFDRAGNLYLADRGNHRVRKIDAAAKTIVTVAGTGAFEASGDGESALSAGLTNPFGLTLDRDGNLYIFDTEIHAIRRVDAKTGVIQTVVGNWKHGFGGDGGRGTAAMLYRPHNGVFDSGGRLVFGDSFNQRIRRWDPATGVITTTAGTGERGSSPNGTPAAEARFTFFGAMAFGQQDQLVFTSLEHRVLAIGTDNTVRVLAGTGQQGYSGDGAAATSAQLNTPYGLAIADNGDVFVADAGNRAIRRIDARTRIISTIAPTRSEQGRP
jgi:trimeric autotransporter adhesin